MHHHLADDNVFWGFLHFLSMSKVLAIAFEVHNFVWLCFFLLQRNQSSISNGRVQYACDALYCNIQYFPWNSITGKKLGVKSVLKFNLNSRDFYAWHVVVVFVFCQTVPVMGLWRTPMRHRWRGGSVGSHRAGQSCVRPWCCCSESSLASQLLCCRPELQSWLVQS